MDCFGGRRYSSGADAPFAAAYPAAYDIVDLFHPDCGGMPPPAEHHVHDDVTAGTVGRGISPRQRDDISRSWTVTIGVEFHHPQSRTSFLPDGFPSGITFLYT